MPCWVEAISIGPLALLREKKTTYPESASQESDRCTPITRLLALWRHALVHTFSKPNVSLHIPRIQEDFEVRWEFDLPDFDISCAVPLRFPIYYVGEA